MHGPLERGAFDRCPRDSIVGVDLNKLPIVTTFNVVGVIINLRSVAAELVIVVCGNTGISSHTALFLLARPTANSMVSTGSPIAIKNIR